VNRRRADAKIFLRVGFGGRPAMQAHVQVDKRQILACLGVKAFAARLTVSIDSLYQAACVYCRIAFEVCDEEKSPPSRAEEAGRVPSGRLTS
jgi:hypothetical protein